MQIINLKEKLQTELNYFNEENRIRTSSLTMGNHPK